MIAESKAPPSIADELSDWGGALQILPAIYTQGRCLLSGASITTPCESPNVRHVYHLYVIRTAHRDPMLEHLQSKGIGAGIHYPIPLHRQPSYLKQGYGDVRLPITEQVASEVISLPMYPSLAANRSSTWRRQ